MPNERYRLYWDAMMMWGWLGVITRKLASRDGVLLAGRYAYEFWPHPEKIAPEDPLHSLAEQLMLMFSKQPLQYALGYISELMRDFSLDGAIIFSARTCRIFSIAAPEIADHIERRLGLPAIVLEADMADPAFYSEAQLDTRLQALFEMMEARGARSRGGNRPAAAQ